MKMSTGSLRNVIVAFGLTGSVGTFVAPPALAATLTNADTAQHTITIIEGGARVDRKVASGGTLKQLCTNGCIVRIDSDPGRDFILEGRERVTIENGLLYYDGELPARPGPAAKPGKR